MTDHVTIFVRAHNEHGVLQRILLMFSRRRLRISALQMFDVRPELPAEIQFDLACPPETARDLARQLARVVEVVDVRLEPVKIALEPSDKAGCGLENVA